MSKIMTKEEYVSSKDLNKCKVMTCKVTELVKKTYLASCIVEIPEEKNKEKYAELLRENLLKEFKFDEISAITPENIIDDVNNIVTFQVIDTMSVSSKTLGLQQKARQKMKMQARSIERVHRNKEIERKALEKKEREKAEKEAS